MKNLNMKLKEIFNRENLITTTIVVVLLNPILDIDHIFYSVWDKTGLPLPSTVLHFLILPLFVLIVYLFIEPKKIKAGIALSIYGAIVLSYFAVHHFFVKDLFEQLYLTNRYVYSLSYELQYVLTLVIPFGLIYAFYRLDLNANILKKIIITTSILISIPLFLSNLFVFGPSTYVGNTMANFPTWFFGIYDVFHPRQLATKFFFSEGNTTGIILFSIYPLLISYYFEAKKKSIWLLVLIFVQGIAMYVLATRVATYGVPIMLGSMIILYLFVYAIKRFKFDYRKLFGILLIFSILLGMYNFTPAVENQRIDSENDGLVLNEDYQRLEGKGTLEAGKDLIPGTAEYNYYYQYMFEQYYFLLTIPSIYYEWYYPYQIDSKFYVDLIFNYELYQRASGRQFERIFSDYKWNRLDSTQKLFGYSYSMFMNGSILLEQDFLMQKYAYGYLGAIILVGPWLMILAFIAYLFLRNFLANLNLKTLALGLSIGGMLGGAYLSGHVLDQFFSTVYLALFVSILILEMKRNALE